MKTSKVPLWQTETWKFLIELTLLIQDFLEMWWIKNGQQESNAFLVYSIVQIL